MEPQIPLESQEMQTNNSPKEIIQDNNQVTSEIPIQFNKDHNNEIENNENPNMNDNNSDFVNNNNYNEEENLQNQPEEEENNQNVDNDNQNMEQNLENENIYENNNNDPNMYNNMEQNEENENMENNNKIEEEEKIPQIIAENVDESIQNYIYQLQNRLNSVINENENLKIINQKIVMELNDSKKRNANLIQKIKILNLQNQKMNQELIKLNQNKNNDIELMNLKKQIQNYEKILYKINNDKEILESKIANMQFQTQPTNKNKNLVIRKNNRVINSPKAKISYTQYTQANTMTNDNNQVFKNQLMILEKNNKKLSQNNIELENQNKYLQKVNQKMFVDLKNKDNYIISLKDKITAFNREYSKQINSFSKDNEQKQSYLDQLFLERDQLMKENNELKETINQLSYKVKDYSLMSNRYKLEYNDKIKEMYDNKLNEYKQKIIILKQRINELLGIETQENHFFNRGNSARYGHLNLNRNVMKKNRSFKNNKNMNILTEFNFYNDKKKMAKDFRQIYSNFNFETK